MNNIYEQFSDFLLCELSEQTVIPLDKAAVLNYWQNNFPWMKWDTKSL